MFPLRQMRFVKTSDSDKLGKNGFHKKIMLHKANQIINNNRIQVMKAVLSPLCMQCIAPLLSLVIWVR